MFNKLEELLKTIKENITHEHEDLAERIKAKKEQYKNIDIKSPDPLKANMKIAAKKIKGIKKDEDMDKNELEGYNGSLSMSEPDEETKNFLNHFEPATKHPKEPTAGMPKPKKSGEKITDTGFKLKLVKALDDAGHRESALRLQNWDELDSVAEHFMKSGYGPKGAGLYNPTDNINRKENRTSEEMKDVGRNKAVHRYTTNNASIQRAHEDNEAKARKKNPAPVKVYTEEEKAALAEKYNMKKAESSNGKVNPALVSDKPTHDFYGVKVKHLKDLGNKTHIVEYMEGPSKGKWTQVKSHNIEPLKD